MEKQKHSKWKKPLRGLGIFALLLVSLFFLWTAYENWSGARAWKEVETELNDEGINTELKNLIPDTPDPNRNFTSHPLLSALVDFEVEDGETKYRNPELVDRFQALKRPELESPEETLAYPDWKKRRTANLDSVAEFLKPSDTQENPPGKIILEHYSKNRADIESLDKAATRPEAVFTLPFGGTFEDNMTLSLSHLHELMSFQKFQALRFSAALDTGDQQQAERTFRTMHATARASGTPPLLLSHLVRAAETESMLTVLWDGLNRQQVSDSSLPFYQKTLGGESNSLLESLDKAIQFEMTGMLISGCDYLKSFHLGKTPDPMMVSGGSSPLSLGLALLPKGSLDYNKVYGCEIFAKYIRGIRSRNYSNVPEITKDELGMTNHRNFFTHLAIPAIGRVASRGFETATACDLAVVALALEQYHADHKAYPDEAGSLVPRYLKQIPIDRFSPEEKPIHYRKTGGRYLLYSVGDNGKDEGGKGAEGKKHDVPEVDDISWGYEPFQ